MLESDFIYGYNFVLHRKLQKETFQRWTMVHLQFSTMDSILKIHKIHPRNDLKNPS